MTDGPAAPEPHRRAEHAPAGASANRPGPSPAREDLGLTLSGRLPCIGCGYDLQGLSVLGHCPECGTAVRAAILYLVDPDADALRPLHRARVVAAALPIWAGAAFLASLCAWAPRFDAALRHQTGGRVGLEADWAPWAVLAGACISAVASLGLVHLLEGVHRRWTVSAAIASAFYLPLLGLLYLVYFRIDPIRPAPYLGGADDADRMIARLAIALCMSIILLGLRPNARLLVARCLALRTGRVDRQTILATLGAVCVMSLGDVTRLVALGLPSGSRSLADLVGSVLVFAGSALFTVALAGATIDTLRIRRSILIPSPSIRQVLGRA